MKLYTCSLNCFQSFLAMEKLKATVSCTIYEFITCEFLRLWNNYCTMLHMYYASSWSHPTGKTTKEQTFAIKFILFERPKSHTYSPFCLCSKTNALFRATAIKRKVREGFVFNYEKDILTFNACPCYSTIIWGSFILVRLWWCTICLLWIVWPATSNTNLDITRKGISTIKICSCKLDPDSWHHSTKSLLGVEPFGLLSLA